MLAQKTFFPQFLRNRLHYLLSSIQKSQNWPRIAQQILDGCSIGLEPFGPINTDISPPVSAPIPHGDL